MADVLAVIQQYITGAPGSPGVAYMATLSDTIKPNKTYLEAVLRTALLGKTEDEYVDFFLSGLRGRLLKNPRLYRSYGPYWPEIKIITGARLW